MSLPVRLPSYLIWSLLCASPALTAEFVAGEWVDAGGSRARLILPKDGAGVKHGAVEIQLEAGAKTYWRTPGETGVPTTADFAGSVAVADPALLFPAPVAFDDGAGGVAYGYIGSVVFPVRFAAQPAGTPTVSVTVDYGVCLKNMCMPAQAKLSMATGQGRPDDALSALVADAVKAVPVATAMAAPGPLSITTVQMQREGGQLSLFVTARTPSGSPALFAEGTETMVSRLDGRDGDGTTRFTVTFDGGAPPPGKPLGQIVLTLVSGLSAIETKLDLDALAKRP